MSQHSLQDLGLTEENLRWIVEENSSEIDQARPLDIVNWDIRPLADTPAGLLASHFIVTISLKKLLFQDRIENGNNCHRTLREKSEDLITWSFFVKNLLPTEFGVKYAKDLGTFTKEIQMYRTLFPRMEEISYDHEPWAPKCFLTIDDRCLVLENLALKDFVSSGSRYLDLAHLKVVMRSIARMTASSIALETKLGRSLSAEFPFILIENAYPSFSNPRYRQRGVESMIKTVQKLLRRDTIETKYPFVLKDLPKNVVIERIPDLLRKMFDFVKPSKTYRNVINESDLWANNILFRYNGNIPVDCVLVDFQFSRYVPPAFDINSILITSTSRRFRNKHSKELLNIYYTSLTDELDMYGIDIKNVLPSDELEESYEVYKIACLIESLLFNQLIYLPEDVWTNLTKDSQSLEDFVLYRHTEICLEVFDTYEPYRVKILELLEELLDECHSNFI